MRSTGCTHPPGARVTFAGGKAKVTDGPFAEAKEVLGGYWMIQVKSREEAIEWATRCPGDDCIVEVRQVQEFRTFRRRAGGRSRVYRIAVRASAVTG